MSKLDRFVTIKNHMYHEDFILTISKSHLTVNGAACVKIGSDRLNLMIDPATGDMALVDGEDIGVWSGNKRTKSTVFNRSQMIDVVEKYLPLAWDSRYTINGEYFQDDHAIVFKLADAVKIR